MDRIDAVTVKLHRSLYTRQAIEDAATVFADFATFAVGSDGDHYVVDVSVTDHEVEGDIVAEFCNFSLANTASEHAGRRS